MRYTTKYSFKKIEAYIRAMGWITFTAGEFHNRLESSETPLQLITNFITCNYEAFRSPEYPPTSLIDKRPLAERINWQGVNEGWFYRSTITDIYRAVIKKFPDFSLEETYLKLYEFLSISIGGTKGPLTFICNDIHRRVYCINRHYTHGIYYMGEKEETKPHTDEYSVRTKALADQFNLTKYDKSTSIVHHIKL